MSSRRCSRRMVMTWSSATCEASVEWRWTTQHWSRRSWRDRTSTTMSSREPTSKQSQSRYKQFTKSIDAIRNNNYCWFLIVDLISLQKSPTSKYTIIPINYINLYQALLHVFDVVFLSSFSRSSLVARGWRFLREPSSFWSLPLPPLPSAGSQSTRRAPVLITALSQL